MSDYPIEMELAILDLIQRAENLTRKGLGYWVNKLYGKKGFERLQDFWRAGFIKPLKFHGFDLSKKGLEYYMNMKQEAEKYAL